MRYARVVELLAVFAVLSFLLWQDRVCQREHYRQRMATQRQFLYLDRLISGTTEQTDHLEAVRDEFDTRLRELERHAPRPVTGH